MVELCKDRSLSLKDLSDQLNYHHPREILREYLGDEEYRRRRQMSFAARPNYFVPDEEVLEDMRRVHALRPSEPLSGPFFDQHTQTLKQARIIQRWETWTKACEDAGVPAPTAVRPEYWLTYDREACLEAVREYLLENSQGTYAGYEQWARDRPNTPSGGTLRNRVDRKWSVIRRLVLEGDA